MDTFTKIDNLRKTHNFPLKSYRKALRKVGDNLHFKLEINTSKYIDLGITTYLKKNKRLLKKNQDTLFEQIYLEYTEALLSRSRELIIPVRNKLQNYPNFIDKLDEELSALDFDISNLKYKYEWHDLEILFSGEGRVSEFLNKTFAIQDTKYNTLLVKHIYNLENKKEQLDRLISKDTTRVRCIRSKINVYTKAIVQFKNFLESNYVDSAYINKILKDSQKLSEAFERGLKSEQFEVPESYKYNEEKIKQILNTPIKDKKKLRKQILDDLEKYFSTTSQMNIPFIPEFYDIAFDYIKFPPITKSLEEAFADLDLHQ